MSFVDPSSWTGPQGGASGFIARFPQGRNDGPRIKSGVTMYAAILVATATPQAVRADPCLAYGEQTTLSGTMAMVSPCPSAEEPGLHQRACKDSMPARRVLVLPQAICVIQDGGLHLDAATESVTEVELDYPGHNPLPPGNYNLPAEVFLAPGSKVTAVGKLAHGKDNFWVTDYVFKAISVKAHSDHAQP